jgi:capsular polysaccharide biosynthesis protein
MSEEALDVRALRGVLHRRRRLLAAAALLGAAAGMDLVVVRPPMYTSTSQVLLPKATAADGTPATRDIDTQIKIALSDAVLGKAGQSDTLPQKLDADTVASRVQVVSLAPDILKFTASASDPKAAEALADALAEAEVRYFREAAEDSANLKLDVLQERMAETTAMRDDLTEKLRRTEARVDAEGLGSPDGMADARTAATLTIEQSKMTEQLNELGTTIAAAEDLRSGTGAASIIQHASNGKRPPALRTYATSALLGMVVALVIAVAALAGAATRDRRLRGRDELADAVGSPVLASVHSRAQRSVAGWTKLLASYEPPTAEAWTLRQLMHVVLPEAGQGTPVTAPAVVTVVCLSDDARALAMGPQLASYAASTGVRTRLVAGQRHESAAGLWAACHRPPAQEEVRPGLFVDTDDTATREVDLEVRVAVMDRKKPELASPSAAGTTLLAVATGSSTVEDLARAAVTIADAGLRIDGLFVADPDELDRTTGRLLHDQRTARAALPNRLTGLPSVRAADRRGRR